MIIYFKNLVSLLKQPKCSVMHGTGININTHTLVIDEADIYSNMKHFIYKGYSNNVLLLLAIIKFLFIKKIPKYSLPLGLTNI